MIPIFFSALGANWFGFPGFVLGALIGFLWPLALFPLLLLPNNGKRAVARQEEDFRLWAQDLYARKLEHEPLSLDEMGRLGMLSPGQYTNNIRHGQWLYKPMAYPPPIKEAP